MEFETIQLPRRFQSILSTLFLKKKPGILLAQRCTWSDALLLNVAICCLCKIKAVSKYIFYFLNQQTIYQEYDSKKLINGRKSLSDNHMKQKKTLLNSSNGQPIYILNKYNYNK